MDIAGSVNNTAFNEKKFTDQLAYWKQRLEGASVALELPIDRSHPPIRTFEEAHYPFMLSTDLSAAVKTLSQQEEVTLFITLLAAFLTLLHRYTGQVDLLMGARSTGGTQADPGDSFSFFPDTQVLRTDVSGNPTFRELLGRVREVTLEAHARQDMPFERLIEALQSERDPLFQVMFVLEDVSVAANTGTKRFDLTLRVEDSPKGLRGQVEYNAALFDVETIARLVGHWQTLLGGILADPGQRLSDLPVLTDAERHQLLVEWNATEMAYPPDRCIYQLFEEQVERTPQAVAVVYENTSLTYQELNARANALAHRLRQLGVGADALVALCVERSLDMVVGLLGILKAGGAYVPLDPIYPSERLAYMLEDAKVAALVTQQHLVNHLSAQGIRTICLDSDAEMLARHCAANLAPVSTPDNLAYVIYTSGSTGRPKGVQIPHRALVNFLISMSQQPGLFAEDTLLSVTTLSFDIAGLELFLPLLIGAHLIVASHSVVANGTALMELLANSRATVMQATPVTWRILLAAGWQGNKQLKVLCGGEALPKDLAQQLVPKVASLWNMYGPTETTIWSTTCKIEAGDAVITIGRPIANTQIYILDKELQLVPIGVPGELYIGGDGLARGYLDRPELTAERFIQHPFSEAPGARLYKTGDLARYRADGTIEHLGRLDFQVKIRGFRIELGEIEETLVQHPSVRQAVVMAREDTPGDKRLAAYIVARHEQAPNVPKLRSFLKEKLPEYMVPSAFIFLQTLPLTPNGKVDRRALPAPEPSGWNGGERFVAPQSPVHQELIQIWEELLDVRPIGIRDNFFEMGGHSLLAVRLIDRIEQVWGKKIAAATLMAGPTIEQLSDALVQPDPPASRSVPGIVTANGSRRDSPIKSLWSNLVSKRGQ